MSTVATPDNGKPDVYGAMDSAGPMDKLRLPTAPGTTRHTWRRRVSPCRLSPLTTAMTTTKFKTLFFFDNHRGVSSSCRRGVNSWCRLTRRMSLYSALALPRLQSAPPGGSP